MKTIILCVVSALAMVATTATAQVSVRGYTRSNGTYVAPHYRSSPNSTTTDNYSVRPNVNPYTGRVGTRAPSDGYSSPRSSYGSSYGTSSYGSSSYGSSYGTSSYGSSTSYGSSGSPSYRSRSSGYGSSTSTTSGYNY